MTKVLIVDDALLIRKQMKMFFATTMEFEVVGLAKDGVEGVDLYKEHSPDLVTLDITMPNKDGLQALQEIIDHDPNARVLMCSALKDKDKVVQALNIGAKGYIEKPLQFKNDEFLESFKEEIEDALED